MAVVEVKVPDIGDFKDVAVIEVLVKPGDTIKAEQSLITVESDKASMEIPSSHAGVVKEMKIKLGDKISNVRDVTDCPPAKWTHERRVDYLDWAERVVAGCRGVNAALEKAFDEAIAKGRARLAE